MRDVRTHLRWLLSLWFVCQLVALAMPAVLVAAGAAPAEQLCTCPGGDHETCPMHHGGSPDRSDRVCAMTNCSAPVDVALLSMAGGAGVLPSAFSVAQPQFSSRLVLPPQAIVHAPIAHDTPPPRR